MSIHWLYAGVYTGLGVWVGQYFNSTFETLKKVYHTFQQQQCTNTILPKGVEPYIPGKIINTLEMTKFILGHIIEHVWIQAEQSLCRTCVKSVTKSGTLYHLHCVIENKKYSVLLKPERGPASECTYQDENGTNCTERVKAYLRGATGVVQQITPDRLGYLKITKYLEGEEAQLGTWEAKEALNH
jgi:hypothetical protein